MPGDDLKVAVWRTRSDVHAEDDCPTSLPCTGGLRRALAIAIAVCPKTELCRNGGRLFFHPLFLSLPYVINYKTINAAGKERSPPRAISDTPREARVCVATR